MALKVANSRRGKFIGTRRARARRLAQGREALPQEKLVRFPKVLVERRQGVINPIEISRRQKVVLLLLRYLVLKSLHDESDVFWRKERFAPNKTAQLLLEIAPTSVVEKAARSFLARH